MAWAEEKWPGRWRGRYRDTEGRVHTAGYANTERKAEKLAEDEEAKIRAGKWFDPTVGKVTFSEYFEKQWLPNRTGEVNTLVYYESMYNSALKPHFGAMQLRKILPSTVQGWVAHMQREGVTPGTIKARVKALQTVLAARKGASALRDRLIEFNPVAGVELPFVPEPEVTIYTPDQSDAVVEAIDPWWRVLPLLAVDIGARWGEVLGLTVDDFLGVGMRTVYIRRTIVETAVAKTGNGTRFMWKDYPKGKRRRKVAISREAATAVQELIITRGLQLGDRLFSMPDVTPSEGDPAEVERFLNGEATTPTMPLRTEVWPEGVPPSRAYFRQSVWLPAIKTARVPERTFHDLRASNISWMLHGNVDLPRVMERVGHTQFQTTKRYTTVMEEVDDSAVDALDAVRAKYRKSC